MADFIHQLHHNKSKDKVFVHTVTKFCIPLQVFISSNGIKIVAPSLKDDNRDVALKIHKKEVVRLLVHFGKGLPVIFLYTMSKCGAYIRKALDMVEDSGRCQVLT